MTGIHYDLNAVKIYKCLIKPGSVQLIILWAVI